MNTKVMFSKISNDYGTPESIYQLLDLEFNFDYDPCPLCSEDLLSLLSKDWKGNVFVNPPYDNIDNFMDKAILELKKDHVNVVVFLVPARTDRPWWHNYVLNYSRDIRWIRGRLKFKGAKNYAPFPSCVIIFTKIKDRTLNEFLVSTIQSSGVSP